MKLIAGIKTLSLMIGILTLPVLADSETHSMIFEGKKDAVFFKTVEREVFNAENYKEYDGSVNHIVDLACLKSIIVLVGVGNTESRAFVGWNNAYVPVSLFSECRDLAVGQLQNVCQRSAANTGSGEVQEKSMGGDSKLLKKGPYQKAYLGSEDVALAGEISSVIYSLSPNQITATLYLTTKGAVIMDELGGSQGLEAFSAFPMTSQFLVIPKDPEAFVKNTGELAVNPEKQLEFIERHGPGLASTVLDLSKNPLTDMILDEVENVPVAGDVIKGGRKLEGELSDIVKQAPVIVTAPAEIVIVKPAKEIKRFIKKVF